MWSTHQVSLTLYIFLSWPLKKSYYRTSIWVHQLTRLARQNLNIHYAPRNLYTVTLPPALSISALETLTKFVWCHRGWKVISQILPIKYCLHTGIVHPESLLFNVTQCYHSMLSDSWGQGKRLISWLCHSMATTNLKKIPPQHQITYLKVS